MDTSKSFVRSSRGRHSSKSAFSLIEVTLAIGIVAYAFIGVFGLVPVGLTTFRQAMDASIGSQITQRVINEAQQTDFDVLTSGSTGHSVRYFDDQGNELSSPANVTYQVNTRIVPATSAPGVTNIQNGHLATVTVQIINNPGHRAINPDATGLWTDSSFSIFTSSCLVSRNQ